MRIFGYFISALFVLCISIAEAKTVNYDGNKAIQYARLYCGAKGSGTTYNPNYKSYGDTDCANFASQALIYGGLDFTCSVGAETISKGTSAKTKGHPSVQNLLSALFKENCFEMIWDPSKAESGDILSSTRDSHVVIYAGNDTYYGHTTDRCGTTGYNPPGRIWDYNVIYRFKDDNKWEKPVVSYFLAGHYCPL